MEKRGLGALEMLALELKASGAYVSRGLSWKGAQFELTECILSEQAAADYDNASKYWLHLRRAFEEAIKLTGVGGVCKQDKCKDGHVCSPMRMFWSVQMRFFKELANASKVSALLSLSLRTRFAYTLRHIFGTKLACDDMLEV
jgi:P-loop containing NTP hydrolase pore-1